MKSAGIMRKNCFLLFLSMVAGIFVSSCGLEVVYSIDEPTVTYNNPLYSGDDYTKWYFNFKTASPTSIDGLSYTGTEVYYRIYRNYSNLNSHRSAILSVNSASNGNSAATKMIETYKYLPLGTSTPSDKAVFFEGYDNTRVVIRIKSFQNGIGSEPDPSDPDYATKYAEYQKLMDSWYSQQVGVGIGDKYDLQSFIPYRNSAVGTKSFDFFDYDEDNKGGSRDVEPVEGDSDYENNSTASEDDCYYVQMFAVARAWDSNNISPVYSLVLDLGSVPIRKGQ